MEKKALGKGLDALLPSLAVNQSMKPASYSRLWCAAKAMESSN
jgi:hypothetical protein